MTRMKRLIPALLCASLSIGSLRAAEWTADQLRLSAPYLQLGYFDQGRHNASVEGRQISIGGVRYASNSVGLHAEGEFILKLDGKAVRATGAVGIDDDTNGQGSVNFQWYDASGSNQKLLWESKEM